MAILMGNQMIAEAGFRLSVRVNWRIRWGTLWGQFTMFSGPMSA